MNTFLQVFVPVSVLVIILFVAAAIANAVFVVLSEFVRFIRVRISEKVDVLRGFRADPSPTRAAHNRDALRNGARG
jgi:hypothetical protein